MIFPAQGIVMHTTGGIGTFDESPERWTSGTGRRRDQ
jgi:predicted Rossmann-fold nucleotide-binding protein